MNKRNRRFEEHLGLHHQGCDVETSVSFIRLTRLIAREDFSRAVSFGFLAFDSLISSSKQKILVFLLLCLCCCSCRWGEMSLNCSDQRS
jgi:hypothetical protein